MEAKTPDRVSDYRLNEKKIIVSPGKFEGEMYYVPTFWEASMDGADDEVSDDARGHTYFILSLTPEDRARFPEIEPTECEAWMVESDTGFVSCELLTNERSLALRAEIEADNEQSVDVDAGAES